MPETTMTPKFPRISDRYMIVEELGRGGMGIVYKAYDQSTKRNVAIKTLWGDVSSGALELFEREWTVLARLSHPNIVDILDTGESEERKPYFVMPLLPGKTLDYIIKNESHRLTTDRVVEMISQACKGLQAAHDQNLVHRDLKPSNLFVMDDDSVKIIDFGIAHLADSHSVTGIKGTLQYMAPEQADMSSPVSARSDIFSLSVVCYEALTCRKPFARRTESDTIDAIRTHIPPAASEINNSVNTLISRTVHKGMAKQPWHRFTTAREFAETLQRACRNEHIERFDPAKIQPRIDRVKKAFGEGDNQFALEILTELESEGHIDAEMPVLRMQIEQSVRQKNITKLLADARNRMQNDEHPLALQKLSEVLAIDPSNSDALGMKAEIERLVSQRQIDGWFRVAEEHREGQRFSQARHDIEKVLKIDGANTRAHRMLAEIGQTEQELSKFRHEKQRLYQDALSSYQKGEISSALNKLERGFEIARRPNAKTMTSELDAQYQSFYNQVRSERDAVKNAYAEGRTCLENKNVARALQICDELLQKYPSDPMFQALKLEAEEVARQEQSAALAEVDRRADAEPDLDKKLNILKEASERFPNETHYQSSVKLVRDRRDLVNSIVERARKYEESGQFAEAGGQWDILRNIYPVYPGLDYEIERLSQARRAYAAAEAKAEWMERIDSQFASGDYGRARDAIQEALAQFPEDKELEGLQSLAEQGVRRSAEAAVLVTQGRELCSAKNYAEGLEALRKAERLDPRNPANKASLLSCLIDQSRDLIAKDWKSAEPLVQEAAVLNADDPVVRSLQSLVESQRRQEKINGILVEARSLQASEKLTEATQKVEEGLSTYPSDVRLLQLHNTLKSATASLLTNAEVSTASPLAPAAKPAEKEKTAAPIENKPIDSKPKADAADKPAVKATPVVATPSAIRPKTPDVKPTPVTAAPVAFAASEPKVEEKPAAQTERAAKKPIGLYGIAAGAVLIVGALAYSFLHHTESKPAPTHTESAVAPPPAAVPAAPKVSAPVTPSLPELRFTSAIQNGSLVFDDGPPTPLQDGSITKSDIAEGDHRVRILDGTREVFSFAFHAAPHELIKLQAPPIGHGASGVVISSLAGAGLVYSTPGLKGGLAGEPIAVIPATGLDVPAADPPRRVAVAEGAKTREMAMDTSAVPVLTVDLNGAPERIPVVVTANVDDGVIVINGKPLTRPMVGGTRTLQVGPAALDISVQREGYQPAAAQHLIIKAGDQPKHLDFQLIPIVRMATMTLTGPPGAAVFIDSIRAGTVSAAGTLEKQIEPGNHSIRVQKAGFEDYTQSKDFKAGDSVPLTAHLQAATGSLNLTVTPSTAKITIKHNSELSFPTNGQKFSLAPGSYVITAAADQYEPKTESIEVEAGKPLEINWELKRAVVAATGFAFSNPQSWASQGGWKVHTGGLTVYTGAEGLHTFDILHQHKIFGNKHVIFVADYKDKGNYTQYSLDGKNLARLVYTDGKTSDAKTWPFAQGDNNIRLTVELSSDTFEVRNPAGAVIDTIHKAALGSFGFVGEVTLNMSR